MLEKKSVILSAVFTYLLSIFVAFILSPVFKFFYDKVLNPPKVGYGLFFGRNEELIIGGIIFSYIFFLPIFTLVLMRKRQLLVWLIGIILPFVIILSEKNYIIWFIIFTLAGGLAGWLINLAMRKLKK